MKWKKLGLVYRSADYTRDWSAGSALTPTPIIHVDGHIRVYAGFRDGAGVSRIGYVDLDADDPTRVLKVSKKPVLDIGRDGCFDDSGVILGDVIRAEQKLYMFYVGFQLVAKAKFLAFSGVAVSEDEGETFTRISEAPVIGRAPAQTTIGAIHSAHYENGLWRLWYARGDGWELIDGTPYPQYEICYVETRDLLAIPRQGTLCIPPAHPEYRIGRPRVYKDMDGSPYTIYYTRGTVDGEYYFPGKAVSEDGLEWIRKDSEFELSLSDSGWDSIHLCYPVFITANGKEYVFYNGNHMGVDGFGCAVKQQELG
jgi:hypothetical protein